MSMENHPSLDDGNEEEKQENFHSLNEPAATPKHLTRRDTSRPTTVSGSLFSRAHGSIHTQDIEEQLSGPWLTAEELYSGAHRMVVGALPFDLGEPAAPIVPREVVRSLQPLEPPTHCCWNVPKSHANIVAYDPPLGEHAERIVAAVHTIEYSVLGKVVLARAVELEIGPPIDLLLFASRFVDGSPNRGGFVVDLSPASSDYEGELLTGSSPEMLVRRMGNIVEAFSLAGPLPRSRNEEVDQAAARRSVDSRKNLDEHTFVADDIINNLAPPYSLLDVPDSSELMSTVEMWHSATHIRGRLKDPSLSVLDLALVVHSTPTICGTPAESALGAIQAAETDRGFYSDAVGWCDGNGDDEPVVSIRCAKIDTEGSVARLWTGGDTVLHSDPEEEAMGASARMGTVLRVFGIEDARATAT